MRIRSIALAAAAIGLAGCGTSGAAHVGDHAPVRALLSTDALMFGDFDTDHDYAVTNAEIDAGVTQEFARADANHDGSIGPIEFQTWANQVLGGGMTPPYRLDFDRNVDNVISAEEFRNEIVARAHAYDADENGVITRTEMVRQLDQVRPARRPGMAPMEPNGPRGDVPPSR